MIYHSQIIHGRSDSGRHTQLLDPVHPLDRHHPFVHLLHVPHHPLGHLLRCSCLTCSKKGFGWGRHAIQEHHALRTQMPTKSFQERPKTTRGCILSSSQRLLTQHQTTSSTTRQQQNNNNDRNNAPNTNSNNKQKTHETQQRKDKDNTWQLSDTPGWQKGGEGQGSTPHIPV